MPGMRRLGAAFTQPHPDAKLMHERNRIQPLVPSSARQPSRACSPHAPKAFTKSQQRSLQAVRSRKTHPTIDHHHSRCRGGACPSRRILQAKTASGNHPQQITRFRGEWCPSQNSGFHLTTQLLPGTILSVEKCLSPPVRGPEPNFWSSGSSRQTPKDPDLTTFRINTCESVSKRMTLTSFRMNTYKKPGGRGSNQ
jgi:hypothetical protein